VDKWFFSLILGVSICIESYRVSLGDFHNPGPGFFPFLIGLSIAALSLALLVQVVRVKEAEKIKFLKSRANSLS